MTFWFMWGTIPRYVFVALHPPGGRSSSYGFYTSTWQRLDPTLSPHVHCLNYGRACDACIAYLCTASDRIIAATAQISRIITQILYIYIRIYTVVLTQHSSKAHPVYITLSRARFQLADCLISVRLLALLLFMDEAFFIWSSERLNSPLVCSCFFSVFSVQSVSRVCTSVESFLPVSTLLASFCFCKQQLEQRYVLLLAHGSGSGV